MTKPGRKTERALRVKLVDAKGGEQILFNGFATPDVQVIEEWSSLEWSNERVSSKETK